MMNDGDNIEITLRVSSGPIREALASTPTDCRRAQKFWANSSQNMK
jgi:hypothetical protein